eukprot:3224588-Pleurochrysis_carterae.AAC.1
MAGDVLVRGRRPAEDVTPLRVSVCGTERGRAKARRLGRRVQVSRYHRSTVFNNCLVCAPGRRQENQ